jgi:hypothetical protein
MRQRLSDDERRAREAFRDQRRRARHRGIAFTFDWPTWWAWWQEEGAWHRRGRGADRLCMARLGDCGPYAPGNVYAATFSENARFSRPQLRLDFHGPGGGMVQRPSQAEMSAGSRLPSG